MTTNKQSTRHSFHPSAPSNALRTQPRLSKLTLSLQYALIGLSMTGHAYAQSTPPVVLPEVRVTSSAGDGSASQGYRSSESGVAGFSEQPLLDTPFSVKVLPKELLTNQAVEDIGALDRLDASVTGSAANPGGFNEVVIRGFNLDNWSNYRYNGLMMVNQQTTGLENKERIEILKGLSALQAGFAAPGGLVNYVTKRPAARPINDLHLTANEYGNAKVHADLSRRTADGDFGVRFNAAWEEQQSYVRDADGDRQFISLAADWRIARSTFLQFDVEHERRDQVTQPNLLADVNGDLPSAFNPRTLLGQTWATYPTESTLASAKLEHFLGDQWSLVAEANWMRLKRDQESILFLSLQPNGDTDAYLYYAPDQTREPVNSRIMAKGKFATGPVAHELAFGYSDHRQKTHWPNGFFDILGATNIYSPVAIADPAAVSDPAYLSRRIEEKAVFFHDVMSFGDAWKLHLGGRQAKRDEKSYDNTGALTNHYDENVFSPSVAVVFKPRSNISTYVSYVEGLQQGGTAPLGATNQNEILDPLTSKQIEVGVKAEFAGVTAEAALFHIDRAAEYVNANNTYVQDGSQVHQGLELSLAGRVASEWTLFGSAMLLDAELEETGDPTTQGKRPSGVPEHRLALVAEYAPTPLPGWTFSGSWSRTGSRPVNSTNTGASASGYDLFGLGGRYNTKLGGIPTIVRVNVDNLFDKRYWANVQDGSLTAGAPRTVTASMSMSF